MNTTQHKPTPSSLNELETALKSALVPVLPRPGFVAELQGRLQPHERLARSPIRSTDRRTTLFVGLAGAFASLIFISAGFRTAAALISAISLINAAQKHAKTAVPKKLTLA